MTTPHFTETAAGADRVTLGQVAFAVDRVGAVDGLVAGRAISVIDTAGAAERQAITYDIETLWDIYMRAKSKAITAETTWVQTVNGCGIGFASDQYLAYYQARMAADQAYNNYLMSRNPWRVLD
jgi:hypothetical protein